MRQPYSVQIGRLGPLLRWFIFQRASFCTSGNSNTNDSNGELSRVSKWITENNPTRIVVLAGAGISTSSGIPDFRSPGSGLYDNLAKYNLPWPEAVFDLEYFYSNPLPFYALAKKLYPTGRYRPNCAHYFMRLLHEKSRLLRIYTQNIDSLERMAGIPVDKLVEAHGTFLTATCIVCQAKAPADLVKNAIFKEFVPKCPKCQNVIKPDIVFFGEELPKQFWQYGKDLAQTDLVLVMGTSLEVYPFANIAGQVPLSVPRVLLNRDAVGSFRRRRRSNDFVLLGGITESIKRLSKSLNWYEDLVDLMNRCEPRNSECNRFGTPPAGPNNVNRRNFSTRAKSADATRMNTTRDSSPVRKSIPRSSRPRKRMHRPDGRGTQPAAISEYLYPDTCSQSSSGESRCSSCCSCSTESRHR